MSTSADFAAAMIPDLHAAFMNGGAQAMHDRLQHWLERYARVQVQAWKDRNNAEAKPVRKVVKAKVTPKAKPSNNRVPDGYGGFSEGYLAVLAATGDRRAATALKVLRERKKRRKA